MRKGQPYPASARLPRITDKLPNIEYVRTDGERSAIYVGHADGIWDIYKPSQKIQRWLAVKRDDPERTLQARTLRNLSFLLAGKPLPPEKVKKRTVSGYFEVGLIEAVQAHAKAKNRRVSWVLNQAVKEYLSRQR